MIKRWRVTKVGRGTKKMVREGFSGLMMFNQKPECWEEASQAKKKVREQLSINKCYLSTHMGSISLTPPKKPCFSVNTASPLEGAPCLGDARQPQASEERNGKAESAQPWDRWMNHREPLHTTTTLPPPQPLPPAPFLWQVSSLTGTGKRRGSSGYRCRTL